MNFLVNRKNRKFYIFEFLSFVVLLVLIAYVALLFTNPTVDTLLQQNKIREQHLALLADNIKKLSTKSGTGFLSNIKDCVDGWDYIGESQSQVNLKLLLGDTIDSNQFPHDPQINAPGSGYQICKSIGYERVQLNAPFANLRNSIITSINIK